MLNDANDGGHKNGKENGHKDKNENDESENDNKKIGKGAYPSHLRNSADSVGVRQTILPYFAQFFFASNF